MFEVQVEMKSGWVKVSEADARDDAFLFAGMCRWDWCIIRSVNPSEVNVRVLSCCTREVLFTTEERPELGMY